MSDMVRAWLDHTDTLDKAATVGPWRRWDGPMTMGTSAVETSWCHRGDGTDTELIAETGPNADAEWIAHARQALPAAVAAIRVVLDMHRPEEYEDPAGEFFCRTCADPLGLEPIYPCPTVKAITGALASHQHPTPLGSSGKCNHKARGITWAEDNTTAYVCETCEHEWTETR